jgi:hypothetical protein
MSTFLLNSLHRAQNTNTGSATYFDIAKVGELDSTHVLILKASGGNTHQNTACCWNESLFSCHTSLTSLATFKVSSRLHFLLQANFDGVSYVVYAFIWFGTDGVPYDPFASLK